MSRRRLKFLFLNAGHLLDHYLVLVFATAAAVRLTTEWDISYAGLIPYATPGFVAFGVCSIPAGWLADRWSRDGMMVVFLLGLGASATLAGFANSPVQISAALTLVGVFAAIYHPVGLAMVVEGRKETGVALAINGVFGNLGVASAALVTGFLIDTWGWRSAFSVPGVVSILLGFIYLSLFRDNTSTRLAGSDTRDGERTAHAGPTLTSAEIRRILGVVLITAALGGFIFQSTTFALPKILSERASDLAQTATLVGWYAFQVFALAALAQLVVGYLLDRHSVRTIFAGVAILQAAFFAIIVPLNGALALVVAGAFMLVVFGQIPINDVLVGRLAREDWRSRAYALRSVVSFSVMALTLPVIGWLHASRGFNALFTLLAILALGVFFAALCLPASSKVLRTTESV